MNCDRLCQRLRYDRRFRDGDRNRHFGHRGANHLGRRRGRKSFFRHCLLRGHLHFGFSLASTFGPFRPSCVFRLCCAFSEFG